MITKIKQLFISSRQSQQDIMQLKQAKMYETQSYLASRRNLQPHTPAGFKSRSSASYYLN